MTLSSHPLPLLACTILFFFNGCQGGSLPAPSSVAAEVREASDWPEYGGGDGQRFAAQSQITPDNVKRLEVAWTYRTGDVSDGKGDVRSGTAFEVTPTLVDGVLYLCTPFNRVISLDPQTGAEHWTYDPKIDLTGRYGNQLVCRGVAHWSSSTPDTTTCSKTIFTATNDAYLIAIDANTGQTCSEFGTEGRVDLGSGVGKRAWNGEYQMTSPPVVIGDLVVVGSSISDNSRVDAPSGVVRAYDARTGALAWAWDLAAPDFDYETGLVSAEGYALGTPNVWAPMVADAARDLVFIPTGNPSPDYFRDASNHHDFYGSSIVALRGSTGEVVWHFQTVHHDLWDFDVSSQPTLIDLPHEGKTVPALVQGTKMGFLFVLNRETGEPIFPVEERPVPQNGPPGTRVSATQPFPVLPKPLVGIDLKPEDAWGMTFWDKNQCRKRIEELKFAGMYTPATEDWTLMYPGNAGGINWGGVSVDPERNILIANTMDLPWKVRLIPRDQEVAARETSHNIASMTGTPYALERDTLMSPLGIPCSKPPWGRLTAVDLTSGEVLWDVPFGTIRDLTPLPLMWHLGVPNLGGSMITQSGLIFIGAALDDFIRAYDIKNGKEVWRARLPAGGQATPMSYSVTQADGSQKQFVVIAAGGHSTGGSTLGDYVIAYSLK